MGKRGGKKGRKTEKLPLREEDLTKIQNGARRLESNSDDAVKMIKVLRYTGMHMSIPLEGRYHLREEIDPDEGDLMIVWDRTKKEGKDARTSILKHHEIDFNVEEWAKAIRSRKRKKSRTYFWKLIKQSAEKGGIAGVSQMSFRHSIAVNLLKKGVQPALVQQILNCSAKTMARYGKYVDRDKNAVLKEVGY